MRRMEITYLGESGFLLTMEGEALLFDPGDGVPEGFSGCGRRTVLVTRPGEECCGAAFRAACPEDAAFVETSERPEEEPGLRLSPGETGTENGIRVLALPSTAPGVAFLCEWRGVRVFHAGGLNLWHWQETSTVAEIEEAQRDYERCLSAIPREEIDVAFFPVDPKQGRLYDAGAGTFVMTVKPRVLIPMAFRGRADAAEHFAVRSGTSATRIEILARAGDRLALSFPDEAGADGAEDAGAPEEPRAETAEEAPEGTAGEEKAPPETGAPEEARGETARDGAEEDGPETSADLEESDTE